MWIGLEMGLILVSVEIGSHDQASFGAGGANEFEHCFVAVQGLGSPVSEISENNRRANCWEERPALWDHLCRRYRDV